VTLPVVWTLRARDRLTQIVKYIAERNPTAARSLKAAIESAPQAAADAPFLFRKGRVPGTREIVVHPNYLVVYRVTDRIVVLNVLHARRRYPE
jgi:toxin ParE1/3/4